jgi:hypothetical protein
MLTRRVGILCGSDHHNLRRREERRGRKLRTVGTEVEREEVGGGQRTSGPISKREVIAAIAVSSLTIFIPVNSSASNWFGVIM